MNCPHCKAKLPAKYKYFFSFGNIKVCPACQKNFELSARREIFVTCIIVFLFAKGYFFPDGIFSSALLESLAVGLSVCAILMLLWQAKKTPEDDNG